MIENSHSQNASTYFPANPNYKWYFKNTPLDSLNNPINSQATYQIDSFAVNLNYQGLAASLVLSKSGLTSINQNAPYLDSGYYNFQGTNALYYVNVLNLIGSIGLLDSTFLGFLNSLNGWYNVYRFSQAINSNYTIFTKDTTLTFDTLTIPLRVSAVGRRLADQNVNTVNGIYLAKKFLITFSLNYLLILPPPFPAIEVPIIVSPDTSYIATGIWKIKEVIPSVNVDLSALGYPITFSIPGNLTELTPGPVGISITNQEIPYSFKLFQNYPNPFNPVTNLNYDISESGFVSLKIYDVLGNEIAALSNDSKNAGSYSVQFDASNLSSGIYFYELKFYPSQSQPEGPVYSDVKRMSFIK